MSRNIILAIDYDGTWTRAPEFFREMVERAKMKGHVCVLVTGRSDEAQWGAEVRREIGDLMPILFCANKWKRSSGGWRVRTSFGSMTRQNT